jgi:hypothetical protein
MRFPRHNRLPDVWIPPWPRRWMASGACSTGQQAADGERRCGRVALAGRDRVRERGGPGKQKPSKAEPFEGFQCQWLRGQDLNL